jgi:hypothetical protein
VVSALELSRRRGGRYRVGVPRIIARVSFGSLLGDGTRLRKLILDEFQRRKYLQNTVRSYIQAVEDFAEYFRRAPTHLETLLRVAIH